MSDIRQNTIEPEVIPLTVEQKMAASSPFDGSIPSLSTEPTGAQDFVPFVSTVDGIFRMKNPGGVLGASDPGTIDAGDSGGLFIFNHKQPIKIERILADFGASVAYSLSLITSAGTILIDSGTVRYLIILTENLNKLPMLNPGDQLQIIAAGSAAQWARVTATLEQRH